VSHHPCSIPILFSCLCFQLCRWRCRCCRHGRLRNNGSILSVARATCAGMAFGTTGTHILKHGFEPVVGVEYIEVTWTRISANLNMSVAIRTGGIGVAYPCGGSPQHLGKMPIRRVCFIGFILDPLCVKE